MGFMSEFHGFQDFFMVFEVKPTNFRGFSGVLGFHGFHEFAEYNLRSGPRAPILNVAQKFSNFFAKLRPDQQRNCPFIVNESRRVRFCHKKK